MVRFSKKTLQRLFENSDLQISDKDCENLLEEILERELDKQKKAKKKVSAVKEMDYEAVEHAYKHQKKVGKQTY